MLKDSPRGGQARRLKGVVCEGEGYEMGNRTKDWVVYFSKEEYRAVDVYELGTKRHVLGD